MSGQYCLYCSAVIVHVGNHRNVPAKIDERPFVETLAPQSFLSECTDWKTSAHRYRLLFLALLGQVLDAVNKELVGADVGPAGLDHPAAQLHQLVVVERNIKIITLNTQQKRRLFKESHVLHNARLGY